MQAPKIECFLWVWVTGENEPWLQGPQLARFTPNDTLVGFVEFFQNSVPSDQEPTISWIEFEALNWEWQVAQVAKVEERSPGVKFRKVAAIYGYDEIPLGEQQRKQGMLSWRKQTDQHGLVRVNYWMGSKKASTSLKHPTRGQNQLYRHNVELKDLINIFENPRLHTNKGYRKKNKKTKK